MKGGIRVSDLVSFHKLMPSGRTRLGIVMKVGHDHDVDKRMLLISWSVSKSAIQKRSAMVRLWVYEEEVRVVSYGSDRENG